MLTGALSMLRVIPNIRYFFTGDWYDQSSAILMISCVFMCTSKHAVRQRQNIQVKLELVCSDLACRTVWPLFSSVHDLLHVETACRGSACPKTDITVPNHG